MFNNISWSSYLLITAVILAVYYFLIAVIFFRNEITKIFLSANSTFSIPHEKAKEENSIVHSDNYSAQVFESGQIEKEDVIQSSRVHELMNELKKVFKKASDKRFLKEELILALQLTLRNYLSLKETPFFGAVNSLIELESQSQCSIYLNEDEMELLWKER